MEKKKITIEVEPATAVATVGLLLSLIHISPICQEAHLQEIPEALDITYLYSHKKTQTKEVS